MKGERETKQDQEITREMKRERDEESVREVTSRETERCFN